MAGFAPAVVRDRCLCPGLLHAPCVYCVVNTGGHGGQPYVKYRQFIVTGRSPPFEIVDNESLYRWRKTPQLAAFIYR